jgi:outer membrane protein assembly factor BamA
MSFRSPVNRRCRPALPGMLMLCLLSAAHSQTTQQLPGNNAQLPYRFSNFVWWSDNDLRIQLQQRIPGLGNEIAPASGTESTVRDELETLLKERQIPAQVQSEDPSPSSMGAERAAGAPAPAIVFSIRSPEILVDKVVVADNAIGLSSSISDSLKSREGRGYSAEQDWQIRSTAQEQMQVNGCFEAEVAITHDAPRHDGDRYLVNLLVSVTPGRQYRISSISAGAGPLLPGRDLSPSFALKPGDIAGRNPFGRVQADLRSYYWRYGYADVDFHISTQLDRPHALVAYRLDVSPGPLYHLQSVTVANLNVEQEAKARELLGLKPGDVFDQAALNSLHHKLATDPLLAGYGFTFTPKKDKSAALVDLNLDFYKSSPGSLELPR